MTSDNFHDYVQGVLEHDRRMLAKTITLIESSLPVHKDLARKIVDLLLPYTGKAVRLGITGMPGAGKSTFIESLGIMLVQKGYNVAVLAVDPSSTRSGGSILADKTRMEKLSIEERAFIRPSPSGGTLGGVARKTRETMLVCEAAGFDVVIVETVGAGQSEVAVASMVDFFLALMIPGAGDELQGMKKGIMELADAVVINKADGDNVEKANLARRQYETALHFLTPSSPDWSPPVLTCSAIEKTGIDKIWGVVLDYKKKLTATGELETKRKKQAIDWMWFLVKEGLTEWFNKNPYVKKMIPNVEREVEQGTIAPTAAADKLLFFLDDN
ncbi:MAG: methylmalonyl Co-A mutase-associated GTPase MeaB [Syntrophobacterales bacterium]|nr:methylmalonyl Co-A mutase-associated GTPase MeaB [Syntrophobacterales bacterium]